MTADHCLNAGIDQRVEHGVDLGTGYAEDVRDTLRLERSDDELCTGLRRLGLMVEHGDLLVGLFGVGEFLSGIPAEVGLEESLRFRKRQMKPGQRLDFELQLFRFDV